MKAIGDEVRLTRLWWNAPEPRSGDALRTRTGRMYLIRAVRGRSLACVVVPPDAVVRGRVFEWKWGKR